MNVKQLSIFLPLFLLNSVSIFCQNSIFGKVLEKNGAPVVGANIIIKDSYDGATTGIDGLFNFETKLTGIQTLLIRYIGFKNEEINIQLPIQDSITVYLKDDQFLLNEVQIIAGSFEAGDKIKSVAFEPLDVALTASSSADIYGALATLPGAQLAGEQGRLFIRGGESYEAKTYIDGLQVQSPYTNTLNNIPAKGRFSPLLFSGTMFSTGGYSAEYGQALSSALILSTNNMPSSNTVNLNLYSVGLGASVSREINDNTGIIVSYDYSNMKPYYNIVKQTVDWTSPPKSHYGTINYFKKTKKSGLFKSLLSYSHDYSALYYPTSEIYYPYVEVDEDPYVETKLKNYGILSNNTYNLPIGEKNILKFALGLSYDKRTVGIPKYERLCIADNLFLGEFKLSNITQIKEKIKLSYGINILYNSFKEDIEIDNTNVTFDYSNKSFAGFIETEAYITNQFTLRLGLRGEYSSLLDIARVSPRLSCAYSLNKLGQVSFAYGLFFQDPESDYLKFTHNLKPEMANHFIFNYQFEKNKRVFRTEVYYKKYNDLIKYETLNNLDPNSYNNTGKGFAKGFDLFYRDKRTIPNGDFWISYSFLDTKRNYKNYPMMVTPKYFSKHALSVVYKQWIPLLKSNIGLTYNFMSGRPYYNPNKNYEEYLSDKTRTYNDISMNYALDLSSFTKLPVTLYLSATNLLGEKHIYGYTYSGKDSNGKYDLSPINAMSKRFYTIAILMSFK